MRRSGAETRGACHPRNLDAQLRLSWTLYERENEKEPIRFVSSIVCGAKPRRVYRIPAGPFPAKLSTMRRPTPRHRKDGRGTSIRWNDVDRQSHRLLAGALCKPGGS